MLRSTGACSHTVRTWFEAKAGMRVGVSDGAGN